MKVRRAVAIRLVGLAAGIGLLAAFTVPSTNGGPSYGVAAANDILALLGNRSPGERTHGKLSNTKIPKLPYEFAKSPVYIPPPENVPGEMGASPRLIAPLVEPETPFGVAPSPTPVSPDSPETPLPPIFTGSSGGTPIFVEGGSSGGGSTSSGGTSTSSGGDTGSSGGTSTSSGGTSTSSGGEPPQPPIVPEPASWFMMLAGFGLVGTMLRRRKLSATMRDGARAVPTSGTDV